MKIVFTYASIILFFVFIHILAIFALTIIHPAVVYVIYFVLFSVAAIYMRKKLFSHLVHDDRAADGVVYFLLVVFPLILYQLMALTRRISFSDITAFHWAGYCLLIALAVLTIRKRLASRFISKIRAKQSDI